MTTLGSWIDKEAVSGLGNELSSQRNAMDDWAGTGVLPLTKLSVQDFHLPENYLPAPFPGPDTVERERVRDMLRNIKTKATRSGLLGRDEAAQGGHGGGGTVGVPHIGQGVSYFAPPLGPVTTRVRALIDWIRRQTGCSEVFIVDSQGNPVSDHTAAAELVIAAVLMTEAARRALKHIPAAQDGAVHLDLPHEKKLCVMDTVTTMGTFCLGVVLAEALSSRATGRLRSALKRAIEAAQPGPSGPRDRW